MKKVFGVVLLLGEMVKTKQEWDIPFLYQRKSFGFSTLSQVILTTQRQNRTTQYASVLLRAVMVGFGIGCTAQSVKEESGNSFFMENIFSLVGSVGI